MRYTKAFKAEQQAFASNARNLLVAFGAQRNPENSQYEMVLQTKLGPYYVTVYPGTSETLLGWVAGRFDNIEEAQKLLGKNWSDPYSVGLSGKWNHHFFTPYNVDDAVVEMKRQLRRIV